MDQIKEKCYQILLEIDKICNCAGLNYYLYAGTLLGAVRHKGFIPWDDDIDIVMMREDYEKFPSACNKYMDKSKYELQTIISDPVASNPWMKLHDKNTAFISGIRRNGAMEGINIDIFPVDNAPDSKRELEKRGKYFDRMNYIYQCRFTHWDKKSSLKMKLFKCAIKCIPPWNEFSFKSKYDKKIQEYNKYSTNNVVYFSNRKYMKKVISRNCFEGAEMLQFEKHFFPVPSGWEKILVGLYGKDYMKLPPEEQRVTVHGTAIIDLEHSWREYRRGSTGYEKV